jgi:hypothetical protein
MRKAYESQQIVWKLPEWQWQTFTMRSGSIPDRLFAFHSVNRPPRRRSLSARFTWSARTKTPAVGRKGRIPAGGAAQSDLAVIPAQLPEYFILSHIFGAPWSK